MEAVVEKKSAPPTLLDRASEPKNLLDAKVPDLARLTARQLTELFKKKEVSPVESLRVIAGHVDAYNSPVNAFVVYDAQAVMTEAKASEKRWLRGEPLSPVDGIPTTVKDLLRVAGWPTLRGSLSTERDGPWDEDCPVATNLRSAGALIYGKTTTSEFGSIPITESRQSGVTRSPWNLSRTPGGSSGGAAVATALGFGPVHVATDGGGSIRLPSSFSGVAGFKPTFGRVPGFPSAHTMSLFHIGCMARTMGDIVSMMNVMSKRDARDWNAVPMPPASECHGGDLKGLRIALSLDFGFLNVDSEVRKLVELAAQKFSALGAVVEQVNPGFDDPADLRRVLVDAAIAILVDKIPEEKHGLLDPNLLVAAKRGHEMKASTYVKALEEREALGRHMSLFHEKWDILLTPTVPCAAGLTSEHTADGKPEMTPSQFAYPFNLTQQPGASIPVGFTQKGMPVGMQIVAAKFNDDAVLRSASCFEQVAPFEPLWARGSI